VRVVAGAAANNLQVGFVAIRELAVLLRNALSAKTQDAHKEVYCWQVRCNTTYTESNRREHMLQTLRLTAAGMWASCNMHAQYDSVAVHTWCSHLVSVIHPPASLLPIHQE
jgi:hypothetical protein